jgi:hypothetical protein
MATTEELFISISPQVYKKNKSSILLSQADLLQILKHLQNLKVLAHQKHDLKKRLHKLLSSTLIQIDSLQGKIPTQKIPKTIYHHKDYEPVIKEQTVFSKRDEIEEELKLIQIKLQKLNS